MNTLRRLSMVFLLPVTAVLCIMGFVYGTTWLTHNFSSVDIISYLLSFMIIIGLIFFILSFLIKKDVEQKDSDEKEGEE